MLVASDAEESSAPPEWSDLEEQGHYEMSLIRFYKNPWLEAGKSTKSGFEVLATAPPNPELTSSGIEVSKANMLWRWLLVCAVIGVLFVLRLQYKKVTSYRIDL